ncbi:hypothetical protein ACH5RR_017942 [Cinchona calisaya]|uniref:Uncharacterized protein n=1 Tax=Cinchona calisaya TaxID=153742 RepID=A0ABD2ZKE1_9GENT
MVVRHRPIGKRRTPCEDKRPRTQVRIPSTAVGAGQPWPWYNNTFIVTSPCGTSSIGKRRTPCEDKRPRTQVRIPSTAVGAGQPWSWYNNTLSSGSHKGDITMTVIASKLLNMTNSRLCYLGLC